MLTQTVEEMKMVEKLDKKNKNYEICKEIYKMFEFEKLSDAFQMLDGFGPVLDSFIKEEMSEKPLKDLKATFL